MPKYLEGQNLAPLKSSEEARKLIGKDIIYLRHEDIDRSGRGYFFPRYGKVVDVHGKNIAINSNDNFMSFSDFVEIVINKNPYRN